MIHQTTPCSSIAHWTSSNSHLLIKCAFSSRQGSAWVLQQYRHICSISATMHCDLTPLYDLFVQQFVLQFLYVLLQWALGTYDTHVTGSPVVLPRISFYSYCFQDLPFWRCPDPSLSSLGRPVCNQDTVHQYTVNVGHWQMHNWWKCGFFHIGLHQFVTLFFRLYGALATFQILLGRTLP